VIAVLDYGIGNLRSAEKALQKVGADAHLISDPDEAAAADAMVLPGVGSFGRCMEALVKSGLDQVAIDGVRRKLPFLGICVGMQLLYDGSEENPGVRGLGLVRGVVRALPEGVKRPQMQWNRLQAVRSGSPLLSGLGDDPWVYFVHSYAPDANDDVVATCDYGGSVVAAIEHGRLWATQFHPEKSSRDGLQILANFVAAVRSAEAA
jgi:glutamine amidotransferase